MRRISIKKKQYSKPKREHMCKPEKIIYYLLSATLFVDFINGIFSNLPIGELYRIVILMLLSFYMFKNNIKALGYILFVFIYIASNSFITFMDTANKFGLKFDLTMTLKAIYFIVIFQAIRTLYKVNKFNLNTIKKIILNNLYYTPFLFLFSYILGIGKTSYENMSVGFKGTFMSLNSINVALIILYIFALDGLIRNKNKFKWLCITVFIIVPMVLLGTKSSLIFLVFAPIVYLMLNIRLKFTFKKIVLYSWSFIFVTFATMILMAMDANASSGYLGDLLWRQQYLFENRDLLTYLLSGRNWLLETGSALFFSHINFLELLFGNGYFNIHNHIAMAWHMPDPNAVRPIELDFFDIFFSYGTLGLVLTYGYFLFYFIKGSRYASNYMSQPYFVALLTLLIFSVVGGHVFLEAISSTFFGLCLAGLFITKEAIKEHIN